MALAGLVLLLTGAVLSRRGEVAGQEIIIDTGACKLPVTILTPQNQQVIGSAVVLHGFSANRRALDSFGEQLASAGIRVFLPDLPGHGDNSQSFSFPRAESCSADLLLFLKNHSEIIPSRTILAGHSMGGAIAIRLADRFAAAGTIAISPAPMSPTPTIPPQFLLYSLPQTLPDHLLVLRGGLEPPATAEADRALVALAQRVEPKLYGNFETAPRYSNWKLIPFGSHVGMLWDSRAFQQSIEWARESLRFKGDLRSTVHAPALGGAMGIVGIFCIFPIAATLATKYAAQFALEQEAYRLHPLLVLAHIAAASTLCVLILNFWIPLKLLRIVTADYLGSFFLLTGLYLLFVFREHLHQVPRGGAASWLAGMFLSLAVVFGLGAWLNWRLDDAWMNGARWLRFIPLALACLPYCLAEELMLGPPLLPLFKSRWLLFSASRALSWVVLVLAFFALHSGQLLIILLAIFMVIFSVLQRLAMDAVRRRTGSAGTAVIFGAILWAWFLAAVLPLT